MTSVTFSQQINLLAERIGQECLALSNKIGALTSLDTTNKTSLVFAINEVRSSANTLANTVSSNTTSINNLNTKTNSQAQSLTTIQGTVDTLSSNLSDLQTALSNLESQVQSKTNISDTSSGTTTTYSSSKVDDLISTAKTEVKNALLNGAGEAYDTLKELADLITANQSAISSLQDIANGFVAFNKSQSLTSDQKTQARTNIDAADTTTVTNQGTRLTAAETNITNLNTKVTNLITDLGDLTTDFKSTFEAALES